MMYDFSEKKKEQELVEEKLQSLKKDYKKPQMSEEQLEDLWAKMEEADMANRKEYKNSRMVKFAVSAAAFIGAFIILPNTSAGVAHAMEQIPIIGKLVEVVTFRDYKYESERNIADIEVPELKVEESVIMEEKPDVDKENQKTDDKANEESNHQEVSSEVQENLKRTTEEINAEIKEITDEIVQGFEANLEKEQGYQDVIVKSEVLSTTSDYFTLKLICYQGAGSGYEWNYYYTIDLNTGERLQLKDIFKEDTDYITAISENIKEQMQTQMDADEMVSYWLNEEFEEWNFKSITEETSFYLNEENNVVIGFDEGEVAPMYMGTVEFEIPAEVLKDMRK